MEGDPAQAEGCDEAQDDTQGCRGQQKVQKGAKNGESHGDGEVLRALELQILRGGKGFGGLVVSHACMYGTEYGCPEPRQGSCTVLRHQHTLPCKFAWQTDNLSGPGRHECEQVLSASPCGLPIASLSACLDGGKQDNGGRIIQDALTKNHRVQQRIPLLIKNLRDGRGLRAESSAIVSRA